jgi:hypothetical protein
MEHNITEQDRPGQDRTDKKKEQTPDTNRTEQHRAERSKADYNRIGEK